MKWIGSCPKEDGLYSYHIEANFEEEATLRAKQNYGENAKVDGKLFMGFECDPENIERMKRKVSEICALKNARNNQKRER